jgi:hypothetical protein
LILLLAMGLWLPTGRVNLQPRHAEWDVQKRG